MRKTIRPNKLNHKPQGVCEENKKELEEKKNDSRLKYFAVEGSNLEACTRTVQRSIQAKLTTRIVQSIKVLVQ